MDSLWHYAENGRARGPVGGTELRRRLADGQLPPDTLVWTDGMKEWASAAGIAALRGDPPPAGPIALCPSGLPGWMGFVGVIHIMAGVFQCLTLFGAVTGVFLIIGGVALLGARDALRGGADGPLFLQKLKTFFLTTGCMYLIGLAAAVIALLIFGVFFAAIFGAALSALSGS